ncbi:SDR family NAD(P)-dependent oxidoreductase [Mucilaginibacter aquariorum]|uniref:SDR family NAD(P)-dependent oxidoreductase n=1 Tax=Mucilaginibacter aquariorum TaxID=2967225 RepID=A0ABT1SXF9_9SPHI|nr:SDR family NAD(P)-dependent oxidoreductase [Mucilaginibacter aquariorum]MCQ6957034.1 SDR family NAD(P)-dependent oxidoreductase [Mucilaginibacter aquariorum]
MELITTGFGRKSTASEVVKGINLKGKRVIITGGASGIGIPTAVALASAGADITLAVRNEASGLTVAKDIIRDSGNPNVHVGYLDVSKRKSIADFLKTWEGPLDILINNAGVMAIPDLQFTEDGWEMQFATNYMGHFELALGLHSSLTSAGNARIVAVSSSGHLLSPVIFDDLHFDFRFYDPLYAYGQSKSAVALFAVAAHKRWAKDGITVNALNPGAIATNLQRHTGGLKTPAELQKTPEQGAATSVLLATSPILEGNGGHYFENCNEAEIVEKRPSDYHGVARYAIDPDYADRLWDVSIKLLGR